MTGEAETIWPEVCSDLLADMRVLRIYPSTPLYCQMLATGDVTENWWLKPESSTTCNELLPSSLSMHFRHVGFQPMQLQQLSLRFIAELSGTGPGIVSQILRVGCQGRALRFAALFLTARQRSAKQARMLLRQVEQAMAANPPFAPTGPFGELNAGTDGLQYHSETAL